MMKSVPKGHDHQARLGEQEFEAYLEYNRILRSWFVVFGIGGPALFLTNAEIGKRLAAKGELKCVATLFLFGAGVQVLGAVVNKVTNWYVYHGAEHVHFQKTARYRCCHWVVHAFGFDVILDVLTVVLFGLSAWRLLTVFGIE